MAGATCEHKVRGGSALSLLLTSAADADVQPAGLSRLSLGGLGKGSPSDSAASASTLAASQQQQFSEHFSVMDCASPVPSPSSAAPSPHVGAGAAQQPPAAQHPLAHSAATAHRESAQPWRTRLPLLACFGSGGKVRVLGEEEQQGAVSASEVGIRPCFYWLESPGISEEDRMFAEANARWLKSDCQDDAVVIEHFGGLPNQTFAGCFDGHGPYGRSAAKFASTRLPQLLAAKTGGRNGGSERKRARAMREAFLEVDAAMRDISQAGFDASLSGTTACCTLLVGRKVLVASSGDSRCVVARRGQAGELEVVPLTWDAKPSLPEEQKRILSAGGVVKQLLDERGERVGAYRVFSRGDDVLPGLAMSRSLGDLYAHAVGVSAEPVLNTYTLTDRDLFLILATDGLWDIMQNEEAADFVQRYKGQRDAHVSCAEALTLEAQERWKALHDEAIVDDISCVILHTAGLPPAERDGLLPRPLARAASCNDEANELYQQWQTEKERNPSNHKPKQYFKHLYAEEGDGGGSRGTSSSGGSLRGTSSALATPTTTSGLGAADSQQQQSQPRRPQEQHVGSARPLSPAPPPGSPLRVDIPHMSTSLPGSSSSPLGQGAVRLSSLCSPPALNPLGLGSRGGRGLDDGLSSQSPISSFGDLASEGLSEPSTRRGSAFAASASLSWGDADSGPRPSPLTLNRHSSGPQPIPAGRSSTLEQGVAQSLPVQLDNMLRPVRKAYLSSSNLQQPSYAMLSHSHRSDGSGAGDTPRSDSSAFLERKVRGGMARSMSLQSTPRYPGGLTLISSHASLPQHPSNASLVTSCRTSTDYRHSVPGSPTGEGMLMSPQMSPVAVPVGGGYTRVQLAGTRVVHAVAPLDSFASMQRGAPPSLHSLHSVEVRADMVTRGSHLSRRITDAAGLAEAMSVISEAGGLAPPLPPQPRTCGAAASAAVGVGGGGGARGGSPAQH